MADPDFYKNDAESKDMFFKHGQVKTKLDAKMKEWEDLSEELDLLGE